MIIQIGVYPPPIGGVSIFIKRLKENLDNIGIKNEIWDISSQIKKDNSIKKIPLFLMPLVIFLRKDIELIHIHLKNKFILAYFLLFKKVMSKRNKIITIHCNAKQLIKKPNDIIIKSLNTFDEVICVKKGDKDLLKRFDLRTNVVEIPAFIPPHSKKNDEKKIPSYIWEFISEHKPILAASSYKLVFHNGLDLYGLDMGVELCTKLKKNYNNIGFLFFLPTIGNKVYYEKMKKHIFKKNLQNNFIIITDNMNLYPILKKIDLFIRPTTTDGDAISIREALYFQKPVVASDCVPRPKGTTLFKTRDHIDLFNKVNESLQKYDKQKLQNMKSENNFKKILNLYEKYLENQIKNNKSQHNLGLSYGKE